ncbi:MAG: hypothetical protein SPJ05_07850 [Candidatus Limisoma sp.]|nr:hypothetical protein [Bacteroidales bacterium]MDY4942367.1 hypothetical protein [Candidatus Limisoma sp.]MDY6000140.1 hypothetical protein [Candidatus Limisoma sp.]MDY6106083.1 hypothetical protein [Candidatus Limisoma sp.]
MKTIHLLPILFLLITSIGCSQKKPQQETVTDHLAQYRDTIVGNFCGSQIDTLICEPLDSISDPSYRGFHYRWRVFAKNKSVKDLLLGNTIGIHFVKEGDLDGDGADEWGYVTEWETSNWMMYQVYTYEDKKPQLLYEPLPIYLFHIEPESDSFVSAKTDIASKSNHPGMVNVKFSDVRNDGEDFLLIDTIVPMLNDHR